MSEEITNNADPAIAAEVPQMPGWLELPRNIKLQRFVSGTRAVTYMGPYVNEKDKSIRLYRIEVRKDDLSGGWVVAIWEDDTLLWSAKSSLRRYLVEYMSVKSLKALLHAREENTKKALRRRHAASKNPVNPVNPV